MGGPMGGLQGKSSRGSPLGPPLRGSLTAGTNTSNHTPSREGDAGITGPRVSVCLLPPPAPPPPGALGRARGKPFEERRAGPSGYVSRGGPLQGRLVLRTALS
jgi:hypothetical protein